MIVIQAETAVRIEAHNADPNRRDGYVEVERPDGSCRREVLAPGERKGLKLNPGTIYVRWSIGMEVKQCS